MSDAITCEHFDLTDAIRQHVKENIAEIKDFLPKDESVSVFLSMEGKSTFQALFRVHAYRKEFVAKESGPNLYGAIAAARSHMIRQLDDQRHKKISQRHEHES